MIHCFSQSFQFYFTQSTAEGKVGKVVALSPGEDVDIEGEDSFWARLNSIN